MPCRAAEIKEILSRKKGNGEKHGPFCAGRLIDRIEHL
jgi:hypothetical protein